ncbi:MAG TPA: MBL fold metallo-hydrolase [Nitriliruptorales bacterium]|nr:MBL fold metallo-hydrolase [Nitriliruptorales bacterium]
MADLDGVTTRVVAPNPGPMTLDGTNTYVVGEPGSGDAVVVDPGPDDPAHRRQVEAVLGSRDAAPALVVVTHRHRDHAAAARHWAADWRCPVAAPTADVAGPDGVVVRDGQRLQRGGVMLEAVATPGHCSDHTAYRLDHGPLLTGDHVVGRGTSVVAYPDGDLESYLVSLRRVAHLGPDAIYPGHGPELSEHDPMEVVRYYLDHRAFREQQILALLSEGPQHTTRLVRLIYADADPRVLPAAAASTRAALEKLTREGRVVVDSGAIARLP